MIAAFVILALGPGDFAFAKPGTTTIGQAHQALGLPVVEYEVFLPKGEIDPFVSPQETEEVAAAVTRAKGEAVELLVLEWEIEDEDAIENARLVFENGVLSFAIVPPSPSESTPAKIAARYGADFKPGTRVRESGDLRVEVATHAIPSRGLAFVENESGTIEWKVVFLPRPTR